MEELMKRMSRISCALALLFMSLGAAPSANAVGLLGFSPDPATINGTVIGAPQGTMPAWFQDQNGVAVQPCLDPVPCGLAARPADPLTGDPGFVLPPAKAISFPDNFPDEGFYFNIDTGDFQVGPGQFTANFVITQEFVFNDASGKPTFPSAPVAVPTPFQRMRFTYTFVGLAGAGALPPGAEGGNFTISTPWGDATFAATDPAMFDPAKGGCGTAFATHDTKCVLTRDLFSVPPNFVPTLGNGTVPFGNAISTFLQDPAAPLGFLSDGLVSPPSFTGAPVGRLNSFSVTDPFGNTGSTTQLRVLFGKKFGMDVAPPAFAFGAALPVTTPVATSTATTITVTNPDAVNSLSMGKPTLTGTNPADFTITADGCSGGILPAAAAGAPYTCTVNVAFTPKRLAAPPEVALRTATVNIPATVNVPGTSAGVAAPPRPVALSGTAQHTLAASAGANGAISPSGAAIAVSAGATQDFTITPAAKFQVKDITVNGTPATFTKAANPTAAVTFTTPADTLSGTTVNATFMPSGDLNGDGILDVKDALKALNILVGLFPPTADDLVAMKVTPLDAAGRPNGTGAPDLNDVVMILRRVLGIVIW